MSLSLQNLEEEFLKDLDPEVLKCDVELKAVTRCLAKTPASQCSCYEALGSDFLETYPETLEELFLTTSNFYDETDSRFCGKANERICDYIKEHNSCCCAAEVETFRKCYFNDVLVELRPQIMAANYCAAQETCLDDTVNVGSTNAKSQLEFASDSGSFPWIPLVAGIAGGILLLVGLLSFNRRKYKHRGAGMNKGFTGVTKPFGDYSEAYDTDVENLSPQADTHFVEFALKSPTLFSPSPNAGLPSQPPLTSPDDQYRNNLRKKRAAIEKWHQGRKSGSGRSLVSYMSEQGLM